MPAYNIEPKSQRIEGFTVSPNRTLIGGIGGSITGDEPTRHDVKGTYIIEVKNNGIIPVYFSSVDVQSLDLEGQKLLSDSSESIGVIGGNSSQEVQFEFNKTIDSEQYAQVLGDICDTGTGRVSVDASISGFLPLFSPSVTPGTSEIQINSVSCDIPIYDSGETEPPRDEPPSQQPPDGGGNDQPPAQGQGYITGPDNAAIGQTATYRYNNPESFGALSVTYNWTIGTNSYRGESIRHTFTDTGIESVVCRVTDDFTGNVVDSVVKRVTIEQGDRGDVGGGNGNGTGGDTGGDTGPGYIAGPSPKYVNTSGEWSLQGGDEYPRDQFEWQWDMGDGTVYSEEEVSGPFNTARNVTHTYSDIGTYTIELTIKDEASQRTVIRKFFDVEVIEDPNSGGWLTAPSMSDAARTSSGDTAMGEINKPDTASLVKQEQSDEDMFRDMEMSGSSNYYSGVPNMVDAADRKPEEFQ